MPAAGKGQTDKEVAEQFKQLREKFETAMNDDLNTSVALSVVFELVRLTQKLLEDSNTTVGTLNLADVLFDRLGGEVLGIVKDEYPQTSETDEEMLNEVLDKFNIFVEIRSLARKNKDFELSDAIREYLGTSAIMIEDRPDGSFLEDLDSFLKRYKDLKKRGMKEDAEKYKNIIINKFAKWYGK